MAMTIVLSWERWAFICLWKVQEGNGLSCSRYLRIDGSIYLGNVRLYGDDGWMGRVGRAICVFNGERSTGG